MARAKKKDGHYIIFDSCYGSMGETLRDNSITTIFLRSAVPRDWLKQESAPLGLAWWCTPLISALGRRRKVDLCEFETSLVYTVSSRTVRAP